MEQFNEDFSKCMWDAQRWGGSVPRVLRLLCAQVLYCSSIAECGFRMTMRSQTWPCTITLRYRNMCLLHVFRMTSYFKMQHSCDERAGQMVTRGGDWLDRGGRIFRHLFTWPILRRVPGSPLALFSNFAINTTLRSSVIPNSPLLSDNENWTH